MINLHQSELFIRVLLKIRNIANNYHTNVIELSFCAKRYNKMIKTAAHNLMGILLFEFHQKKKANIFMFTLLPDSH